MIRNTFVAVLTLVMLAGSARGEQIKATLKVAYGKAIEVYSEASGRMTPALGPYAFRLSSSTIPADGSLVALLLQKQGSGNTLAFCFDLYQTVNYNTEYTYDVAQGEDILNLSLPAPVIQPYHVDSKKLNMLAYLWNAAYKEGAYTYQATRAGHALSLAIWETMFEYKDLVGTVNPTFDVESGPGFKVLDWKSFDDNGSQEYREVRELANGWLDAAYRSPQAQDIDWLLALYSGSKQDQTMILFPPTFKPVPEPTLAIQLLGLCVAGVLPLRYWRRRKGAA